MKVKLKTFKFKYLYGEEETFIEALDLDEAQAKWMAMQDVVPNEVTHRVEEVK